MNTPYIGFFRRAIAFLLDNLLITLLPAVICLPLFLLQYNALMQMPQGETQTLALSGAVLLVVLLWQVLVLLLYWLYFALFESSTWQATPGKKLLRIKVVDRQGRRLSFAHASGRALARFLSYMTFYVGFVLAGCSRRKRALHDMIAQTYVVRNSFQPGDDLPETPAHPFFLAFWCLVLAAVLFISVAANMLNAMGPLQAAQAAARLQELAQTQTELTEPLQEDMALYFRQPDGYRAILKDDANTTLFLANTASEVCCEQDAATNCAALNIPACE